MKRTVALHSGHLGAASVLLTMSLLFLAGCSEEGAGATAIVAPGGLDESEVEAIANTSNTSKDFRQALKTKQMEKKGVVLPTKASAKVNKKIR